MSTTDDQLCILTQRPYFEWSNEDKASLPSLIKILVNQGSIVVLGKERCFFCGIEIENEIASSELTRGTGKGLLVTNLCTKCSALTTSTPT